MGRWRKMIGLRQPSTYFSKPVFTSRCRSRYDAVHMSLSGPLTRSHLNESSSPLCAPTPVSLPSWVRRLCPCCMVACKLTSSMHHDHEHLRAGLPAQQALVAPQQQVQWPAPLHPQLGTKSTSVLAAAWQRGSP